jgi:hypothetical protein
MTAKRDKRAARIEDVQRRTEIYTYSEKHVEAMKVKEDKNTI